MNVILKRSAYAMKLMFSGYFYGALCLGIAFAVATIQMERWYFFEVASVSSVQFMMTVVMPLFTIVLAANGFAEELEESVFPLLWTYACIKPLLFLERLWLILLWIMVYLIVVLLSVHHLLLDLSRVEVFALLRACIPVHIFLAGVTLFFSLISRNMLAGLAAGALYWLMEIISRGLWTKGLYLFQVVWPIDGFDPLVQGRWILAAASIWIALCLLLFMKGRSWIAKSNGIG